MAKPGGSTRAEPPDAQDTEMKGPIAPPALAAGDQVPGEPIPSSGRGNSDDGKSWENPSANQLFRALHRKQKAIEEEDAPAVANVHAAVTKATWDAVREYEDLHSECKEVTLARFYGMFGIPTYKSRWTKWRSGVEPFDRHDWIVDRCGKEVRYVIDYYSYDERLPTGHSEVTYSIDARPALTFSGIYDRLRLARRKWWAGESYW
jgi:cytochrome c heme-lyase